MQATPFLLLTGICLLAVLGRPDQIQQRPSKGPAYEVRQEEEYRGERPLNELRITFQVKSHDEEPIADIIWLRKAAKAALDQGSPYFNVLDQNISGDEFSMIDGTIQLEKDPMTAEYDANEILSLILSDESL